jgi:hypothetical protein
VQPSAGQQVQPDPGITLRQKPLMRATIAQRPVPVQGKTS